MGTVEHPKALNSEQHRAFAEKVACHAVGIVNGVRRQTKLPTGKTYSFEDMGTGSACSFNRKRFILTAKHVLEDAELADLRFFLRLNRPIDWGTRPSVPAFGGSTRLRIEKIVRCRWEDLACTVLDENNPFATFHFCDLPSNFAEVPKEGGVLVTGYPSDQSTPVMSTRGADGSVQTAFAAKPMGSWVTIATDAPPGLSSAYDPEKHFLISFDPVEEGAMPFGYSGTGVWYQKAQTKSIWSADPVLAGVQISWYEKSKLMVAVRSDHIREFLRESL